MPRKRRSRRSTTSPRSRAGVEVEALVLNVQPRFPAHVARFTSRADRDALRAERSRAAMAQAIERCRGAACRSAP